MRSGSTRIEPMPLPFHGSMMHFSEPSGLDTHIHPTFEVGILLRGELNRHFEGLVTTATPGGVWLCAPWELHAWQCFVPDTLVVALHFMPEFVGDETLEGHPWVTLFAPPPAARPRITQRETLQETLTLGRKLRREIEEMPPAWLFGSRLYLLELLLLLYRAWEPEARQMTQHNIRVSELGRIAPAIALAYSEPTRRVTLAKGAAACALSASRFGRVFAHTMGVGFREFSLRVRLGHVAHLLRNTDRPLEAIAEAAGFADRSHLNRAFANAFGCTPGRYRHGTRALPGAIS